MRYSEWNKIRTDGKYSDILWKISHEGQKAERLLRDLGDNLNEDNPDYPVISKVLEKYYIIMNSYSNLLANIIYPSEDKKAIEKFKLDLENIQNRLDFEQSFAKQKGNRPLSLTTYFTELRNLLNYMLNFLLSCKRYCNDSEKPFNESVVDMIKITGGGLQKKQYIQTTPDKNLIPSKEEEREEEVEEAPEMDSGMELFKDIAEKVGE